MKYQFNTKMVASLIATTLIVSGLAYAATTITNTSQTVVNNDIMSAAWFNDVNSKLANLTVTQQGNVGVGVGSPSSKFAVSGTIESTVGGFKFPDGTIQTTAKNRAIDDEVSPVVSCPTGQCDFSAGGYSNTTSVNLTKGIYLVSGYACGGQQGVDINHGVNISFVFLSGNGSGHSTWTDFNNSRSTCGDSTEPMVLRVRSDVATVAVRLTSYRGNSFWVLPTNQNTINFYFQSLWK